MTHQFADPLTLLFYLGFQAKESNGWPKKSGFVTTAYVLLSLYMGHWFSNRWRNGLIPIPRLNSKTWLNEIVLVTGGAQGIGSMVCEKLAQKGARVASIDIVDSEPNHPNIRAYKCDISKFPEMERTKNRIVKEMGGNVTMVANVAGLNNKSLILDLDAKHVDKMIDVNLKSRTYR